MFSQLPQSNLAWYCRVIPKCRAAHIGFPQQKEQWDNLGGCSKPKGAWSFQEPGISSQGAAKPRAGRCGCKLNSSIRHPCGEVAFCRVGVMMYVNALPVSLGLSSAGYTVVCLPQGFFSFVSSELSSTISSWRDSGMGFARSAQLIINSFCNNNEKHWNDTACCS